MDDLRDIETAPKDGTVFWGTHNRRGNFEPLRKMYWGVGKPHTVHDDSGAPAPGYVVNKGNPWWINEDGLKMAPTPTHWKPLDNKNEDD